MVSARDSVAATTVRTRKEGAADAPKHRGLSTLQGCNCQTGNHTKSAFYSCSKTRLFTLWDKSRGSRHFPRPKAGDDSSLRDRRRSVTTPHRTTSPARPRVRIPPPRGQSTATPRSPTARENAHDSPSRSHAVTPGAGFVSVNNDRSDVRLSRVSRGRERDASRRCASNSRRRATRERCEPSRATRRGVRRRVFGRLADGADVRRNIRADVGFRSVGARASVARRPPVFFITHGAAD